ncbi:MAG TPA: histidine phosphatase family protein [Candidatus Paceibacterota bacterium]|nr:histidine phosphatase family protein [Candidatus Paceibacterota bacterium]
MNHLATEQPLKNAYFAMRHGTSVANEEGVIVSDPTKGVAGYGLSEKGRKEVRAAAQRAKETGLLDAHTIVISSDFTRARETAEMLVDTLDLDMVTTTPKLRERFFGAWDGTHNDNYQKVWADDAHNATHTANGVESVAAVLDRATKLIAELEQNYAGKPIVLVSHGDTLQILQTAFADVSPETHRSLTPLHTAEIRKLN